MKPFMMKFRQGKGKYECDVWINMNQVCHIMSDGGTGSVLTFSAVIAEEPAYLCVNESPELIGNRTEWHT
jgi:hypothetical protein